MPYGTINVDKVVDTDGGVLAPISSVFRNRIINGAMVVNQRAVSVTSTEYVTDRWQYNGSQVSKGTAQQSSTAPASFNNSLLFTSSSAFSVGANDYFGLQQKIEGYNVADLGWGTANAKTVTLSFWVQSSLTGTFSVSFVNADNTRSYAATYTISAANTWEQKYVTVAGDTSGTWGKANGAGITVWFGIGTGSTYSGTAGAWSTPLLLGATGATSVVGTNGATFYITGVQLEKGSTATSFDYRPYGTELSLCQRYCQVYGGSANQRFSVGWWYDSTNSFTQLYGPVNFRSPANISLTVNDASNFDVYSGGTRFTPSSVVLDSTGQNLITIRAAVSGATAGNAAVLIAANTSARLTISNEL
jgi:hypothetical protein